MNKTYENFTKDLEDWYTKFKRPLPWRGTSDPYLIWVSEIMGQQTQIQRVADYFYPRFIEVFPTVEDLAKASWEELFPLWDGLGFYSRGKNMLKTAHLIVSDYNGAFPMEVNTLEKLPGIGKYTASAIVSFCTDAKIPAIDTNISMVIKNLWPKAHIQKTAQEMINYANSGRDWNEAMMDLASFLRLGIGPSGDIEKFFPSEVVQKFIPQKKTTRKYINTSKKLIEVGIACIWKDGKYLIQTRPEGKSFEGIWEFPGGKREKGEDFRQCVKREVEEEIGVIVSVRPHFQESICNFEKVKLKLRFHRCQIQSGVPSPKEKQKIRWVSPSEFDAVNFLKTNAPALKKLKSIRT